MLTIFSWQSGRAEARSILKAIVIAVVALAILMTANQAEAHDGFRLPKVAVPSQYTLRFEPDLKAATFKGQESIALQLLKPVYEIELNAVDLAIERAHLATTGDATPLVRTGRAYNNPQTERTTIKFDALLKPGRYRLDLSFRGTLNDKLRGFYRASYVDASGARQLLATTQMEPTDARRMFPCFDEPDYKARYQITAVIDPSLQAVSNAPIVSSNIDRFTNKRMVCFAKTPPMSTYLVALVVGRLEATEVASFAGVPVAVWTTPGKSPMGLYAREIAGRLLTYYTSYFGVPYPSAKLDLIAIPDFEAGAMENLGAITARESLLLLDEKSASLETRQHITAVLAHEMAHMWFGNLVTMSWWDDLWLNEAFATWMGTKAVDHLRPQWHFWDQFVLSRTQALSTDSLKSTRPIHYPVVNPDETSEMFDEITYSKGASILRMLEKYVGEEMFRKGVRLYIKEHAFGNAKTEQLWQAIGKVSGQPISQMMNGWVYQPGYPLISMSPAQDNSALIISQRKFMLDPAAASSGQTWVVPLGMKIFKERLRRDTVLLKQKATPVPATSEQLLTLNADGTGYYRVDYPRTSSAVLTSRLQHLSAPERLALVSDRWALLLAGLISLPEYLPGNLAFRQETNPAVMSAVIGQLYHLDLFVAAADQSAFQAYVRDCLLPSKGVLGWKPGKGEPETRRILRSNVLTALGTIGQDQQTITEAKGLFATLKKPSGHVDPDVLDAVTAIAAFNGKIDEYEAIKQFWLTAKTPEAEKRNLLCLGDFRQPELIAKTLALSMSNEVRAQDAPHLISTVLSNKYGCAQAWQFISDNWKNVLSRLPLHLVPRMVSAASSLSTVEQERQLRSFFEKHTLAAGRRAVARTIERVHINAMFRAKSGRTLSLWLTQHYRVH